MYSIQAIAAIAHMDGLIRSAGLTEEAIAAEMAASSLDRETAVKKLFAAARAQSIMNSLLATPAVPSAEDEARIAAAQARVAAAVAERNAKNARVAELRTLIAGSSDPVAKCAWYEELVAML